MQAQILDSMWWPQAPVVRCAVCTVCPSCMATLANVCVCVVVLVIPDFTPCDCRLPACPWDSPGARTFRWLCHASPGDLPGPRSNCLMSPSGAPYHCCHPESPKIPLLRCNSYSIHFIHFKYIIGWSLEYAQYCKTIILAVLNIFFITTKRILCTPSQPSSPKQPLIYFYLSDMNSLDTSI